MILTEYLITKNAHNNIKVAQIDADITYDKYSIQRTCYILGSEKKTAFPVLEGTIGYQSRNVLQQGFLVLNSVKNGYIDKGYKPLSDYSKKSIDELTKDDLVKFLETMKTDGNNIPKPMLAISSDKVPNKTFNSKFYISRKLDGVRNLMYTKKNNIYSASRGGKNYNSACTNFISDPELQRFFKEHPEVILDGEIYKHGLHLNYISGLVRLKDYDSTKHDILEYWIYDYISDEPFEKRYENLMQWRKEYEFQSNIKIIDHELVEGWLAIKKHHDKYVKEGYEGAVIRHINKGYGIGLRSATYMIKVKQYQDDEFKVVGWEPGLRPVEDMCFVLETSEGKQFKAKPMGDKDTKEEYIKNIKSLIGKKGTVKFFYYSPDNIPQQPVFKNFREEGE